MGPLGQLGPFGAIWAHLSPMGQLCPLCPFLGRAWVTREPASPKRVASRAGETHINFVALETRGSAGLQKLCSRLRKQPTYCETYALVYVKRIFANCSPLLAPPMAQGLWLAHALSASTPWPAPATHLCNIASRAGETHTFKKSRFSCMRDAYFCGRPGHT